MLGRHHLYSAKSIENFKNISRFTIVHVCYTTPRRCNIFIVTAYFLGLILKNPRCFMDS